MKTEKELKKERFFGLQKFNTFEKAFNVVAGLWGDMDPDGQPSIFIATEKLFKLAILSRAIEKYVEYKAGEISLEDCNKDLGIGETVSEYLLDFDFILYAKSLNSFYTCRMFFKDDYVTEWNEKQWGYFTELYKAYSFGAIVKRAKKIVDSYYKENSPMGKDKAEVIYTDILNDQGL